MWCIFFDCMGVSAENSLNTIDSPASSSWFQVNLERNQLRLPTSAQAAFSSAWASGSLSVTVQQGDSVQTLSH